MTPIRGFLIGAMDASLDGQVSIGGCDSVGGCLRESLRAEPKRPAGGDAPNHRDWMTLSLRHRFIFLAVTNTRSQLAPAS